MYFQVLGGHRHLAWKLGRDGPRLENHPRVLTLSGSLGDGVVSAGAGRARPRLRTEQPAVFPGRHPLAARAAERGRKGRGYRPDRGRAILDGPGDPIAGRLSRLRDSASAAFASIWAGRRMPGSPRSSPSKSYEMFGWEDDRVRCQLFRAEVASRLGDLLKARSDRSTMRPRGFLHSGSVEHLCVYHLVRARIAMRSRGSRRGTKCRGQKGCTWRGGADWGFIILSC